MPEPTPLVPRPSGSADPAHPPSTRPFAHRHAYTQIALTYFRRKMFWIVGGILLFIFIYLALPPFHSERPQLIIRGVTDPAMREYIRADWAAHYAKDPATKDFASIFPCFVGLLWVLKIFMVHLKQQIASPRAVLIPNYRRPHILVAAAFVLPILFLFALGISADFTLPFFAVLAITTLFSALTLWTVYLQKWPLVVLLVLFYCGLGLPALEQHPIDAIRVMIANLPTSLFITVGLAALAALIALAHRLMRLREEMPEYSRQIATNQWQTLTTPQSPQSPAPQINYHNPLNRLFYAAAHRELARLAVSPPTSLWARLQRWRLAGNPISFTLIFVPIVLLQIFGMARLTGSVDVHLWSFDLIGFPALVIPQLALTTWRTLGIESLRPFIRAAYLRERAAFVALQFVQIWFITAATMLACAALLQPQILRNPTLWFVFAASALAQFPIFAIFIWFLRLRSPFATIVSFCLSIGLCIAAIGIYIDTHLSLPVPWLAAIFLAILLASALLLRDAYRRWLRTDLA